MAENASQVIVVLGGCVAERWRYRARRCLPGAISELLMLGIPVDPMGRVLFSLNGNDMEDPTASDHSASVA